MNKKNQYSKLKLFLNKIKKYYDMFDKKFLTVFLGMFLFSGVAKAIEITPASFVYQLSALGNTQTVTFYNRKDRPERIKISFIPYQQDGDDKYLGKWGTIYPRVITVPPKDQKEIKFSIEAPGNLPKGEYRAVLFMEELEQKSLTPSGKVVMKEGTANSQVNMLINLGAIVYGYSGNPNELKISGKVSEKKVLKNRVEFKLKNDGEVTKPYRLFFEGIDKEGKNKIEHKNLVVVQGYEEKINHKFPETMTQVNKIYLLDSNNQLLESFK